MSCVVPADPDLEKESPWSQALGQRLESVLPKLGRCSMGLPPGDEARVTLRLVYAKDGTPISRHVVDSTPDACPLVECLEQELAKVTSPELLIDKGSYDLALVLERGQVPRRASDASEPLTNQSGSDAEVSCIDPQVALFSRANVLEILRSTDDGLTACHGQALVRDHDAAGRVKFELVIGDEGEVVSAEAREATFMDCEAIHCMLDQFRALRFPAPVGRSVRLIYPLNYRIEQPPVSFR
jgi:hypothetical protein